MRANILPSEFLGTTEVVTSKSYYIRALILAALSAAPVKLIGTNESGDVLATVKALETLGAVVEKTDNGYIVTPVEKWPKKIKIDVGESATLLRILVPVLCAKGIDTEVTAAPSLVRRPVNSLIKPLSEHGVVFTRKAFPLKFSGKLTAGRYVIADTTTSGVVSGLLIALSVLDGSSEIVADINSFNKGYIDITIDVLRAFGQAVDANKKGVKIKGTTILGPAKYKIEKDWSNAAVWLTGGALCGNVTVKGLNLVSAQFDRMIVEYLSRMGAEVSMTDTSISVKKSALHAITADMGKNMDIVPAVAAAAAVADGVTVLQNIERLALKESNRIEELIKLLDAMGIKAEFEHGNLKIYGGTPRFMGEYVAPNDHRIIFAAALLGAVAGVELDKTDGVRKSYPEFFDDFTKLGGKLICQ